MVFDMTFLKDEAFSASLSALSIVLQQHTGELDVHDDAVSTDQCSRCWRLCLMWLRYCMQADIQADLDFGEGHLKKAISRQVCPEKEVSPKQQH